MRLLLYQKRNLNKRGIVQPVQACSRTLLDVPEGQRSYNSVWGPLADMAKMDEDGVPL